jgi:hypothetical protein
VKFFIWRLPIGKQLLSDWQAARVQEEPIPHDCRYTTSIWKPKAGEGLLRLDVYEEPSRQSAELRLLDLLANFQSPLVRRDVDTKYPLFRYGEDTTLAFTRGNLTFLAANAERKIVSLNPIIADIDQLFSVHREEPAVIVPALSVSQPANVRAKEAVLLPLAVDYPLPCWYRIETKLGEVHREGSRLMYEAASAGAETVHISAIGADGHAARVELTFTVSETK